MSAQSPAATVLVTGGSGFLGGWCVVELLRRGYKVRTTVRELSREGEVRAMLASEAGAGEQLAVCAADLRTDEGWTDAAAGCDYILHVASPFPAAQPKDPDELIVPAREGTLRVLRAGLEAGARRVVVTSSSAAVRNSGVAPPARALTEEDWSQVENPHLSPYARSKTIAERAAWDYADSIGEANRLTVVNPSAIVGPLLSEHRSSSIQAIERLLSGAMPAIPRLGFSFVDVHDVADLQITAMSSPAAAGERFLATGPFLWIAELADMLRANLGASAAKVPRRTAPSFLVRIMARFDRELRSIAGDLDQKVEFSAAKAQALLGWTPRPIQESVLECAHSIIDQSPQPA